MPNLNDTQRVMLSIASQRDNRSLFPLDKVIKTNAGAHNVKALLAVGFVEELETNDQSAIGRVDGDINYGIFVTGAGLAAIGVSEPCILEAPVKPARGMKSAVVISLLERDEGATLAELITATDWLPHTTRAALTGLRKKGHTIERSKRDNATCYRIVNAA